MKVIISHDVDHITCLEHWKDLSIPKFMVKSLLEVMRRAVSFKEFLLRVFSLFHNKWHNIDSLIEYDKKNNIPSTFYVGVAHGLGLSYSNKRATIWIKKVIESGFRVGLHGIAYDDFESMKKEREVFSQLSGLKEFGIRMHYLRSAQNTLKYLAELGYVYDAGRRGNEIQALGDFYSFPVQVMDSDLINSKETRLQIKDFDLIKEATIEIIETTKKEKQPYLSVIFHDRYFGPDFLMWKKWYIWVIEYLKNQGFDFCTYEEALEEIRTKESVYKQVV
jgi:peptidoglycan/xylan/chitin deacetylase (PgdA/CDA1 family)